MFPAARIGDPVTHDLQAPAGLIGPPMSPPTKGPVIIEGLPAAHVECTAVCSGATSAGMAHPPPGVGAPPVPIIVGSPTVLINGRPAARWAPSGDTTACGSFLGDPKLAAQRKVFIGGPTMPLGMSLALDENGDLKFGSAISVTGTDHFKAMIVNRLMKIGSTDSGKMLFKQMENTGKQARISEYAEENSEAGPRDWEDATPSGKPVFDGSGSPILDAAGNQLVGTGLGSDSDVKLNPKLTLDNHLAPDDPMPNDAVLFHELTHSKHQMSGSNDCTPKDPDWDTQEEANTIREDSPSEADYLHERGYKWRRTSHGETFEPNP
jgi:uncharacterized Zn-binding protein involved in type VI secretion